MSMSKQGSTFPPANAAVAEWVLVLDEVVYPRAVVLRTCYALADRYSSWITYQPGGFRVALSRKSPSDSLEDMAACFETALTDFALREEIESKTAKIREQIVEAAFAGLGRRR